MLYSWLPRTSLILSFSLAAAALTSTPSKRDGCTIRWGSIHLIKTDSGWDVGWLNQGDGASGQFKAIWSDTGIEANQGLFYFRDCGDSLPIVIYCSGCHYSSSLGLHVDVSVGTQRAPTSDYANSWYITGITEFYPNSAFFRRDQGWSTLWTLDPTSGSLVPELVNSDGSSTTARTLRILDSQDPDDAVSTCMLWPAPNHIDCNLVMTDNVADEARIESSVDFSAPATLKWVDVTPPSGARTWAPPDDTTTVLCS